MRSASIATASQVETLTQSFSWGRRLVMGVSGAVLVFAPLAYGAVHPWAYFPVGLAVAAVSIALLVSLLYKLWAVPQETLSIPYPPLWWLAGGLLIVTFVQVMPWPQAVVAHLSPRAWEIRSLGNGFGLRESVPLSLNPYGSLLEGLKLWPALVLFFLLIFALNSREKLFGLVGIILAVGLFEVFYGFWHFRSHLIWGWKNPYTGSRLCGTFINSNQLATFLTMAILLGFGLFLGLREAAPPLPNNFSSWEKIKRWTRPEHIEPQMRRLLLLFLLLLLAVGLIFTGSRGGMIALLVGFALMGLLIWGQRWKRSHIYIMIIFIVAAILYSLSLGSGLALDRFSDQNQDGRYFAFKGALHIFREFPLLGSGLATFGEVFYRYEPARLGNCYFLQTHSDWLQLLAETGLAGFSLVAGAWMAFFSTLAKQWSRRRQGFAKGLTLGGIAALSAGVFHALVDFPFHIPAVSLMFAAIAALTYAAAYYHRQGFEFFSFRTLRLPGNRRLGATLVIAALILVQVAFGVRVCYNWLSEIAAPTEIDSTRTPTKLAPADYRRALGYINTNSKYYFGLAESLEARAMDRGVTRKSAGLLRTAVFYAPANWGYRLILGNFYLRHYQDDPDRNIPRGLNELNAAVALFPESPGLHFRLAATLAWAEKYYPGQVPPSLKNKVAFHFAEAVRLEPKLLKKVNAVKAKYF